MSAIQITCLGPAKQRVLGDHVDRSPVASVDAYRDWIAATIEPRSRHKFDPVKLRRAVIMRRQLEPFNTLPVPKKQFDRLPDHLK